LSDFLFCTDPFQSSHLFFFYTDPSPTEIYTLSLHDALPICSVRLCRRRSWSSQSGKRRPKRLPPWIRARTTFSRNRLGSGSCSRSEEHTSELQSRENLVCRLLLEKKKKKIQSVED